MHVESIIQMDNTPNHYKAVIDGVPMLIATRAGQDPMEVIAEVFGAQTMSYIEKRVQEYPSIQDQLDMIYHDMNGWRDLIAGIKARHPKP